MIVTGKIHFSNFNCVFLSWYLTVFILENTVLLNSKNQLRHEVFLNFFLVNFLRFSFFLTQSWNIFVIKNNNVSDFLFLFVFIILLFIVLYFYLVLVKIVLYRRNLRQIFEILNISSKIINNHWMYFNNVHQKTVKLKIRHVVLNIIVKFISKLSNLLNWYPVTYFLCE